MPGKTNRGKYLVNDVFYRGATAPTNFYVVLVTSAAAPGPDTNTLSQLTEIAAGNGYTANGFQLSRNSTDFDSLIEDDANDRSDLQIKNVAWTAAGGNLPASGGGARYVVLTDDNATPANRVVIDWWDLGSDVTVSSGQSLTLTDLEIRASEGA